MPQDQVSQLRKRSGDIVPFDQEKITQAINKAAKAAEVEDLKLADLNGDGRLDIIAAGRQTKNVRIFFNLGAK